MTPEKIVMIPLSVWLLLIMLSMLFANIKNDYKAVSMWFLCLYILFFSNLIILKLNWFM